MTKLSEIVYENGPVWVQENKKGDCYTVFINGMGYAVSDSSYHHTDDGLSIAKARCDYLAEKKK